MVKDLIKQAEISKISWNKRVTSWAIIKTVVSQLKNTRVPLIIFLSRLICRTGLERFLFVLVLVLFFLVEGRRWSTSQDSLVSYA